MSLCHGIFYSQWYEVRGDCSFHWHWWNFLQSSHKPTCQKPGTSKTGFGQVKIMKEFAWKNIIFFPNLPFEQVGEKKLRQRLCLQSLFKLSPPPPIIITIFTLFSFYNEVNSGRYIGKQTFSQWWSDNSFSNCCLRTGSGHWSDGDFISTGRTDRSEYSCLSGWLWPWQPRGWPSR